MAVGAFGIVSGPYSILQARNAIPQNSTMQPSPLGRVGGGLAPVVTVGDPGAIKARNEPYLGLSDARPSARPRPSPAGWLPVGPPRVTVIPHSDAESNDDFVWPPSSASRSTFGGVAASGAIATGGGTLWLGPASSAKAVTTRTRPRERRNAPRRTRRSNRRSAASSSRNGPSDDGEGDGDGPPSPEASHVDVGALCLAVGHSSAPDSPEQRP